MTEPSAIGPEETSSGGFAPTRWTRVLAARGDTPAARRALADLCEAYYQPVLRFLRREGRDGEEARELTQGFFAAVLARHGFDGADPGRGRFRSYLLGALRHHLGDRRDHDRAVRRGGGIPAESLDADTDTGTSPGLKVPAPEEAWELGFDREWAIALMARSLARLETEFRTAGRGDQFDALRPWLGGEAGPGPQSEAAARLGLSGGALKVAIHRLRRRFREIIRSEVADTVPDPSEVDAELRHLVEVLARAGVPSR